MPDTPNTANTSTEATPLASEQITDPKHIYLQPQCCVDPHGEGRQWCEDDGVWEECYEEGCQCKSVRYVREDLAALSASPAPSGQGVSGEVLLPAEPGALAQSIATIEAWERSGDHLGEIENEVALSESICLCLHELKRLRTLAAPAPSCASGEVEHRYEVADDGVFCRHCGLAAWRHRRAAKKCRCSICGGSTFVAVDVLQFDGTYAPGLERRCVECKTTFTAQAFAALSPQGLDAKEGGE